MNSPLAQVLAAAPLSQEDLDEAGYDGPPGDESLSPSHPAHPDNATQPEPAKVTPKTQYLVQIEREVILTFNAADTADKPITAWEDLGTFEAQNQRQAVQRAMQDLGLKEGRFRAISETSARIHAPRMTQRFAWD